MGQKSCNEDIFPKDSDNYFLGLDYLRLITFQPGVQYFALWTLALCWTTNYYQTGDHTTKTRWVDLLVFCFCNFCTEVQGDMGTDVLGGGISPSLYPTIPIDSQDSHNTRSFMPSSFGIAFGFFHVPQWTYNMAGICETGPTVYCPYPRRLESLTICWFNYKGSTLYAVILRPWVLVWPNSRPPAWQPDLPPTEQPVRGTRNCRVVNVLGGKASCCIQWVKYCIILAESTLDWPNKVSGPLSEFWYWTMIHVQ